MDKRTQETLKRHAEADQVRIDAARDREIASKATDGPWAIDEDTRPAEVCAIHGTSTEQGFCYVRGAIGDWDDKADDNAKYIAHFNPKYIQEIIDAAEERDALRERVEELEDMVAGLTAAADSLSQDNYELLSQSNQETKENCDERSN